MPLPLQPLEWPTPTLLGIPGPMYQYWGCDIIPLFSNLILRL
jgi:hypothetical protein